MDIKESEKLVEVLPNRLYWFSDASPPVGMTSWLYFCIDKELKYYPYFFDYGPFNIAQVIRFATELEKLLNNPQLNEKIILHYTSNDPVERVNAAFLMGCFMVG